MGDIIEITTWPKHQNLFYRITSGALIFEIKAPGNAAIGLAKVPGHKCDYWVCIGDRDKCWIRAEHEHCKWTQLPSIVNNNEFKKFWLSWNNGGIRLGRHGDSKPFVTHTLPDVNLSYVTFSSYLERNPVHWKFEVPPIRSQFKLKPLSGGKMTWVPADNRLPAGAMIGGFEENETLYIIRATHRGSLTPGKFVPSLGLGFVSWGGDSNEKSEFEVLCGYDCIWVPTVDDKVPVGAVPAGHSEVHHETLYIGRAEHNGHLIPGKVQPSHRHCYIPYEDKEIGKRKYEILIDPSIDLRCANKSHIVLSELNSGSGSENDEDDIDNWVDDFNEDSDDEHIQRNIAAIF